MKPNVSKGQMKYFNTRQYFVNAAFLKIFSPLVEKYQQKYFSTHLPCSVILALHNWWKCNRGFVQLMAKFALTADFAGSLWLWNGEHESDFFWNFIRRFWIPTNSLILHKMSQFSFCHKITGLCSDLSLSWKQNWNREMEQLLNHFNIKGDVGW